MTGDLTAAQAAQAKVWADIAEQVDALVVVSVPDPGNKRANRGSPRLHFVFAAQDPAEVTALRPWCKRQRRQSKERARVRGDGSKGIRRLANQLEMATMKPCSTCRGHLAHILKHGSAPPRESD